MLCTALAAPRVNSPAEESVSQSGEGDGGLEAGDGVGGGG